MFELGLVMAANKKEHVHSHALFCSLLGIHRATKAVMIETEIEKFIIS